MAIALGRLSSLRITIILTAPPPRRYRHLIPSNVFRRFLLSRASPVVRSFDFSSSSSEERSSSSSSPLLFCPSSSSPEPPAHYYHNSSTPARRRHHIIPSFDNYNSMKLRSAPFLAALSLTASSDAFQIQSRGLVYNGKSRHHGVASSAFHSASDIRRNNKSNNMAAESLAEVPTTADDEATTTATTTTTTTTAAGSAEGRVLSILTSPSSSSSQSSFAVVKVCEEDFVPYSPSTLTATGAGVAGGADGSVPLVAEEGEEGGDRVELADALFGNRNKLPPKPRKKDDVGTDGDLTGRTVTFADSTSGIVVAHRHPVAFVLLDTSSSSGGETEIVEGAGCVVSAHATTLDPSSVPPGSTVDYLGRHVSVSRDGSVGRTLPRAASSSSSVAPPIADVTMSVAGGVLDARITESVVANNAGNNNDNGGDRRPIFVSIPKISDIGLIDSPLVTGITAVDALTPIGKGQNMLVIGPRETTEDGANKVKGKVDKRGWMIHLLRNVVENEKRRLAAADPLDVQPGGCRGVRCFYGLTSGDDAARAAVSNGIDEAGVRDDVVTVVSSHSASPDDSDDESDKDASAALEAAEAVAVAAAACSLGEHHALTTGGDSLVIIDDVNLHKSLWDVTTRELVSVYGADAVVEADLNGGSSSEMRGFFSGLIQRAARFKNKKGGGSLTLVLLSTLPGKDEDDDAIGNDGDADGEEPVFVESDFEGMAEKIKDRISMLVKAKVPLTPSNLAKIDIPAPRPSAAEDARRLALQHVDDLISMSDGQVWLDAGLAEGGRSPPLDPSRSMTRVGVGADTRTCRADAPALRSVAGSLRFEFQQAADVLNGSSNVNEGGSGSSSSSNSGNDSDNVKQVRRRDAFLLAMHQEPNDAGRRLSQECVALLAAAGGHLDGVLARGAGPGTPDGKMALEGLLGFVEREVPEIMASIDETLDLTSEEREILERVMR